MSNFTQVFYEDFNGNSLDRSIWKSLYSGQHGNGMFRWDPSQLEMGDGKLTIATERDGGSWMAGGLSTIPVGQTYGSYEFHARMDAGKGTSAVILLWPSNNQWTDEVDIVEAHRGDRSGFAFVNHGDPMVTNYIDLDLTQWHTFRLDWTPGDLRLFVNGNQVSQITQDVPSQPMSLSMQTQVHAAWENWFGGAPDGSTPSRVELEVDWVRVSSYTPGSGDGRGGQVGGMSVGQDRGTNQDGGDWLAKAYAYLERDGFWEGSWRNQVSSGQITVEDVAGRLQAGLGNQDLLW
ncbi:MAG TPA: glycoside hydrolase family 16 protein [Acetobacteraceae bacterium]|jgi:beta-glucanase (GH16 family)|nr:glycoside hydrolase family 16 protein [Acetobacteraceae bacterium]